jgi:3-mercaptopyruvate sulfurtransferase SseA
MSHLIQTLAPATLASWIKDPSKKANKDYVIIDVRDDDFHEGGSIPTALNVPSATFMVHVEALVREHKHTENVIFHCMYFCLFACILMGGCRRCVDLVAP